MHKTKHIMVCLALIAGLLLPTFGDAGQPLKIVVGDALPPWVIPEAEAGIQIDILKETLESAGYQLTYLYVPYARRIRMYQRENIDAVCDMNSTVVSNAKLTGHLSVMAYAYENIGVSLKERGFRFSSISDLVNHSVVAWQGAKITIGDEYAAMAEKNSRYREVPNQQLQIRLLYAGRSDVIQLDRQIFAYYRKIEAANGYVDTNQPIDIFPLFGKNESGCLFKSQKIQEVFNNNFQRLLDTGRYDEIFQKYSQ